MLEASDAKGPRILVVDDDPDICETLRLILEDHGYLATTAANGEQALRYLRSGAPLPKLILLDLMMPLMNGWEFRGAQKKDPALAPIPVVVITASGAARERVGLLGVRDFLLKPIVLERLLETLASATAPPSRA